ncbi:farnesol dehydrogenase-like [Odontomachus brunneus]|uniref:farnesol dehydrogenase-like n=1 Tax=Odontomachus brunneus TaxID=486640 RepID=UPI0013F2428A|nr:farnesol dehydrogenase-like [Odontomachus brunneus]XP_032683763.1 farnesol dehydrogenase-like [Odontomachus brunneus]
MDRWLGKTALVTGAATGIGEAITRALLRNGVNVAAADIQKEKLARLLADVTNREGFGRLYTMCCDMSKEEDIDKVFAHIENAYGGVDIMINNAGVIDYTRMVESDRKTFERLLNINVLAVATCVNKAVRSMRGRNVEGHVFNVNSILGHEIPTKPLSEITGSNGFNLYPATKHATVALTHTVRRELAVMKLPIRITSISPGLVRTEIAKHNVELRDIFDEIPALMPSDVADALIYALATRPEVQITELTIQRTGEF